MKPRNDGIGGSENAKLPADDVVVLFTLIAWPKPLECNAEEKRAAHDEDDAENVLGGVQHGDDLTVM
jgi:hypothetical protein